MLLHCHGHGHTHALVDTFQGRYKLTDTIPLTNCLTCVANLSGANVSPHVSSIFTVAVSLYVQI